MNRLSLFSLFVFAVIFSACDSTDPYDPYRTVPPPYDIAGKEKVTLPNGLVYYVVQEGVGEEQVTLRSTVDMYFTARLVRGRIFDSSYIYGSTVPIQRHLPDGMLGVNYGAMGMKIGEKRKIIIPPAFQGSAGISSTADTLFYDVQIDFIYPQKIAE